MSFELGTDLPNFGRLSVREIKEEKTRKATHRSFII